MAEEEKQEEVVKDVGGRPSCYTDAYEEQVYKLCLLGATDKEIGDFFGVSETTINNWKLAFPRFLESIKRGKIQADMVVAEKLFERAKGYEHPEEKVFCQDGKIITHDCVKHYPPETAACFIWLKNRRKWTDRTDITTGGEALQPAIVNFADLAPKQVKDKDPEQDDSNSETAEPSSD